MRVLGKGFHDRVYRLVARVPRGFVTTYGDVAEALGLRRCARHVGYALAALPAARRDVPWQRVVTGRGEVPMGERQARLLRKEGVVLRRGRSGLRVAEFAAVRAAIEFLG